EKVKSEFNIPVSLDTYKGKVAAAGIAAGADMINDIWGLKYDEIMAEVIGKSKLPCCLMHNRKQALYGDFMEDMAYDLSQSLYLANKGGIDQDKIILDPGIGFAKTYENNLTAMNQLEKLRVLNCPLLLGTSRKSVIGLTLDVPVTDRMEGTLATTVIAVMKGCSFVRVHDIKENVMAIKMTEAILAEKKNVL
ncbi:MAG: dihydropteroate synthase, partial [Clostridiales bacterium]|nr:dihydropteroate synthase [Clostridiales bacterium]